MLHIASPTHRRGKSIRSLCGAWNVPTVENPGWGGNARAPREACPACRRKSNGGK